MIDEDLIEQATAVRQRAYSRYSGYSVGAALIDDRGDVYIGCNVENAAYPQGSCAETGAIAAMIAGGGSRIVAIAVAGGSDEIAACTPCGGCRQRINEFADGDTRIILNGDDGTWQSHTIDALLPHSFQLP